ncbi:tol-pal system protein YbgF [Caulobacter sp. KR2-114]|uniref:tol-pal system protein YbgF n=1 Tax=Caulobacter sp. KR2-114 TaxID=3400912 RepID=UPI003C0140F7
MGSRRLSLTLAACVAALAWGGVALAQTSLDDPLDDHSAKRLDRMEKVLRELRAIVFQGRETGQPIVVQPADTQNQIAALSDRVNDLDQTLQRVNGQLDQATHALDESRRTAQALRTENAQLKARLDQLEQRVTTLASPPPAPPGADGGPPPDGGRAPTLNDDRGSPPAQLSDDPATAFQAAKRSLFDGHYDQAEAQFSDFVGKYGDSPRGPEARYYYAKTLLARKAYSEASLADIAAIRGWPQTPWAPDAVFDLSRALINLKRNSDACGILQQLSIHYPKANADLKARAAAARTTAQCQ